MAERGVAVQAPGGTCCGCVGQKHLLPQITVDRCQQPAVPPMLSRTCCMHLDLYARLRVAALCGGVCYLLHGCVSSAPRHAYTGGSYGFMEYS